MLLQDISAAARDAVTAADSLSAKLRDQSATIKAVKVLLRFTSPWHVYGVSRALGGEAYMLLQQEMTEAQACSMPRSEPPAAMLMRPSMFMFVFRPNETTPGLIWID